MIRLSVNVLTSIVTLLKRIEMFQFSSVGELRLINQVAQIDNEDLFSLACTCNWAMKDKDSKPLLTERGRKISTLNKNGAYSEYLHIMLFDYILSAHPIWANRIPYGRTEATIFMTKDEKACFFEANLLNELPSSDIVTWWDNLADNLRLEVERHKIDIGRQGEQLTIYYERKRTMEEPKWVAIDSNLAGYDIKSQKSEINNSTLLIEVKTSYEELENAFCYLSVREWTTALTAKDYLFHFWCLSGGRKRIAVVLPSQVDRYVPTNNLSGKWESVKIPFACFKNDFIEVE
jgi:hypothetical protein